MKLHPSPWDFKGIPSQIGESLGRTQRAPKNPAPSLIFTKKQLHPLRNSEASKVASTSRAPTANINTVTVEQRDITRKIQRGSMR
jgi:hypothetical protein